MLVAFSLLSKWVVMVVVVDLQLPIQSVNITTKVVSSNPAQGEVYSIQHYSGFLHQQN